VRGTQAERFYFTKSDKNGRFEFSDLPADKEVIFRVTAKGFGELDTGAGGPPELKYVVKPDANPAELVLEAEAKIVGQITSKVPNLALDTITVRLEGYEGLHGFKRTAKPDAKGKFAVDGLPAGSIAVSLVFPADAPATAKGEEVTTVIGTSKEVSLEAIAGVEVTGKVVIRPSGEPLPEAWMAVLGSVNPGGFHFAEKGTGADGQFKMRLPPGKVIIRIWSPHPTIAPLAGGIPVPLPRGTDSQEIEIPADVTKFTIPDAFEFTSEKKKS